MATLVQFRNFDGEIIALFPETANSVFRTGYCMAYVHMGQHFEPNFLDIVWGSRPARPDEYNDLLHELRRIGYTVKVAGRINWINKARKQLHAL